MIKISQRIEQLRSARGMSRPALAEALGLPRLAIEKIETGRLTPTAQQQQQIADYFGVSLPYLRGESSDPTTMDNWLNGNLPAEEPEIKPVSPPQRKVVASTDNAKNDGGVMNAMLKSDAFQALVRQTVLDVLRSKEGQAMLENAVRKQMMK